MVADKVTCGADNARNFWALANKAPDEEEGGFDVVGGEHIKQLLGIWIVRPVIIGKGELMRSRAGDDDSAEDLRRGPHGGVGISACSQGGCGSGGGKSSKHVGLV